MQCNVLHIFDIISHLQAGRTGLTKFVWPFQKSRQNLSLPNFQFVKCGRTETVRAKYLLTTSVNHTCGLHTDVYLVGGLHRDVQIEQNLALEIQLEHRLGSSNSCSLSKDRYAAYPGTNLPPSPFDCSVNMK